MINIVFHVKDDIGTSAPNPSFGESSFTWLLGLNYCSARAWKIARPSGGTLPIIPCDGSHETTERENVFAATKFSMAIHSSSGLNGGISNAAMEQILSLSLGKCRRLPLRAENLFYSPDIGVPPHMEMTLMFWSGVDISHKSYRLFGWRT